MNDPRTQLSLSSSAEKKGLSQLGQGEVIFAYVALAALGAVTFLAFLAPSVSLPDRIIFLPLGLIALTLWNPFVLERARIHREIATFILTVAMFLIYSLARTAGPIEGIELRFAALPDDVFVIPYSSYVVVFAALLSTPTCWRRHSDWTRSIVGAIAIIALLAVGSFGLLRQYFPTGPTEILDPTPLPTLAMKLIEYGCIALLCHVVAAREQTRLLALRLLPAVLLFLWLRHQFFIRPEEIESE